MTNQAQNRQSKAAAKKSHLAPEQTRDLHYDISHQGYGYQEILEAAKEISKNKLKRKRERGGRR